jgi:alpha-tubulin suppressor-like RCC1 family protein
VHGALYRIHCNIGNPNDIISQDDENTKIFRMSAGVDISMAVSTTGDVYAWGKTDGGRIGLGSQSARVTLPRRVRLASGKTPIKAVDVECGYVHSMIVGLNGVIFQCGGVGVDGEADGQSSSSDLTGEPTEVENFNIWHRIPEPNENAITKEKYKKYGKYEVRGRAKMMEVDAPALK